MADVIDVGLLPDDGNGDKLRTGGQKINAKFAELEAEIDLNTAKVTNATHTGDATGSGVLTLATVNASPGTYYNATITVNGKGLVTSASSGTATYTALKYSGTQNLNAGTYTSHVTTLASTVVPYSIMLVYNNYVVTHNHDIRITTWGAFLALDIYSSDNLNGMKIYIIY